MTFSVDEFEKFSKEWNDARCRVTGGRYGEKMKTLDAEKAEKRELILRLLVRYQLLCKGAQNAGDEKRASTLSRQVAILEKIAKDYE